MKHFWNWLLKWWRPIKKCNHPNLKEQKWRDDEGTPMVTHYCPDCKFWDIGHVHADPKTWLNGE